MSARPFHEAPMDGTPILVDDGDYVVAVRFYRWTDEDRENLSEISQDTEGYWEYCDGLLGDACPGGPEVPFRWWPHPDMDEPEKRIPHIPHLIGLTDQQLRRCATDYEAWETSGALADDALLREIAARFGKALPTSGIAAALAVFRELAIIGGQIPTPAPRSISAEGLS